MHRTSDNGVPPSNENRLLARCHVQIRELEDQLHREETRRLRLLDMVETLVVDMRTDLLRKQAGRDEAKHRTIKMRGTSHDNER